MDILSDRTVIARKDYRCNACDRFRDAGLKADDLTEQEIQTVRQACCDRWQIRKGQPYRKTVRLYSGIFDVYRAREDMHALCERHRLPDDA